MRTFIPAGVLGLVTVTACASSISLTDLSCPCADGYMCCNDQCISESLTCSSPVELSSGDDDTSADDEAGVPGDNLVASVDAATPIMCATVFGDAVVWMDAAGKMGGTTISTANALTLARFELPADPVSTCSMTNDGSNVYVTLYELGALLQVSVDGTTLGQTTARFGAFTHPSQIANDATNIYVLEDLGQISRIAKPTGGAAPTAVALGQTTAGAHDLIADGSSLFWLEQPAVGDGSVRTIAKQGGFPTTVASTTGGSVVSLTSEGGNLFWIEDGVVLSTPETSVEATGGTQIMFPTKSSGELDYATGKTFFDHVTVSGDQLAGNEQGNVYTFTPTGTALARWVPYDTRLQTEVAFFADASRYVWVTPTLVVVHPLL